MDGFDMDFDKHIADSHAASGFDACKQLVVSAFSDARELIGQQTDEALLKPLPEGPIMGGAPAMTVVSGIADHTAHHRGSLSVYARLLGKTAPMPYA